MEKQKADQVIVKYSKKIYGFAMKKSYSYEEAEELCADMISEVYLSLLRADEVINVEGYIWRICEHTYAKYVAATKQKQGVSIDGMEIPYYDEYDLGDSNEELNKLRKEIGFLSSARRKIVYSFYYEGKSIRKIAMEQGLSEGTVKWHLNKARNDLKEGFLMERKVGKLGLSPIEAFNFSHNGKPGMKGGPEYYLEDKINMNIVYSVYDSPKTLEEIAEEMGITPVYLEERIHLLAENGFLVETKGKCYTTYVKFTPQKVSLEMGENILKMKFKAAKTLVEHYVPKVRAAIEDFSEVYIPGGNRELFEAAVIFYAIAEMSSLTPATKDLGKYRIKTLDGGDYFATVDIQPEIMDPEYQFTIKEAVKEYNACGSMTRGSSKYPQVKSWSVDSRFSSRTGGYINNWNSDYEAVYEVLSGTICDDKSNAEKFERMKMRGFITEEGKINLMIVNGTMHEFFDRIPRPDKEILDEFAGYALEQSFVVAKMYPPQLQDYVVSEFVSGFIGYDVAMMVMDELYDSGTFKPLTENEMVTSNSILFTDKLPAVAFCIK